jgi:hypothetical protein
MNTDRCKVCSIGARKKEQIMRKYMSMAAAGLLLAFSAAGADAQSLLNRPSASPYAVLNEAPNAPVLSEGRAAFVAIAPDHALKAVGPLKSSGPLSPQSDGFDGR